ncbi:lysis system i-spanin subunit Rz [Stenotrophomonas rhizophila]|uniref:lysis system i-spanin subunit Rz n=1 Tax=Stenotrophomonas rhizophila TaxID=216778 RepID=UPI000EAFAD56|nr:lysis system i-spanin subunit Rz [Stenotrophomonas rhizophila]
MNRTAAAIVAFIVWTSLIAGGGFAAGWSWKGDRAEGKEANQRAAGAEAFATHVNDARQVEHTQGHRMATIGAKYEEDRAAAETVPAAVVAELRAGTVRLRHDLATCHTGRLSEAAPGAVQRDAPADLGVTVAGPAIGIGRDADDQLRACQAVIAADRAEMIR